MKYGFVYIWRDKKHKRYYVGAHWGTIDDGYICSSGWMMKAYNRRAGDFKRRIIKTNITSRPETFIEEMKYLSLIKPEELKRKYYNLNIKNNEAWYKYPENVKKISEKISHRTKEAMNDPKVRERYLEGLKFRNTRSSDSNVREKRRKSMIGKNVGKDNSESIRISAEMRRGVPLTEVHKQKLRDTTHFSIINNKKTKCKYCDFVGNLGNISRYHNERCRKK